MIIFPSFFDCGVKRYNKNVLRVKAMARIIKIILNATKGKRRTEKILKK